MTRRRKKVLLSPLKTFFADVRKWSFGQKTEPPETEKPRRNKVWPEIVRRPLENRKYRPELYY